MRDRFAEDLFYLPSEKIYEQTPLSLQIQNTKNAMYIPRNSYKLLCERNHKPS